MRGAFAGAFPAKSGTHDAPVRAFGLPSQPLSLIATSWMKAFVVGGVYDCAYSFLVRTGVRCSGIPCNLICTHPSLYASSIVRPAPNA